MDEDLYEGQLPPGEHTKPGTIKAIDKGSVHHICSGQVVLTLATAVKELVENSIDAGATIVDIKLKEYGSEVVEVIDNGSGVHKDNFHGLTLKHHTSKLQDFSDLVNVDTFGFRGEALSSLCALRHRSADVGTKLEFDYHGRISSETPQARQVGTTVTLCNLFSTLPVRHKEFQRNLKKEFVKMVQVLNSYCIISTRIRITCSNQTSKGQRSVVVSSKGNISMKENISNVFGPKQLNSVLEFQQVDPSEAVCTDYGIKHGGQPLFRIQGYVSKCVHGQGRSSADRQFYFINNRPCDSTKLSKVVNEVYHQYNRHQYPFVALHVTMAKDAVDVNVTPDKRQIFLQDEKLLLATIKTSLLQMYEPSTSVLQMNNLQSNGGDSPHCTSDKDSKCYLNMSNAAASNTSRNQQQPHLGSLGRLKRSFSSAFAKGEDKVQDTVKSDRQASKQRKLDMFVSRRLSSSDEVDGGSSGSQSVVSWSSQSSDSLSKSCDQTELTGSESGISSSQESLNSYLQPGNSSLSDCSEYSVTECNSTKNSSEYSETGSELPTGHNSQTLNVAQTGSELSTENDLQIMSVAQTGSELPTANDSQIIGCSQTGSGLYIGNEELSLHSKNGDYSKCLTVKNESDVSINSQLGCVVIHHAASRDSKESDSEKVEVNEDEELVITSVDLTGVQECSQIRTDGEDDVKTEIKGENSLEDTCLSEEHQQSSHQHSLTHYDEQEVRHRKEKTINVNMNWFRNMAAKRQSGKKKQDDFCRSFRAQITPSDNQSAEEELRREITKDMFSKMEILGQFNLGFIITKNAEDLFIVDQHATDEKYNFEMLQRHTVIQSQKLIQPQSLELTAMNETILMDNIEIFRKNGFEFIIDENGPPTQRVKLVSTPVSKNWNFGKEDIEELIFMLTDSPGIMCRPSRVRQMFASRACRKSIMIGTALSKSEMMKLVSHMGDIDQPWNCPHGRPTMRHLINLNMVPR